MLLTNGLTGGSADMQDQESQDWVTPAESNSTRGHQMWMVAVTQIWSEPIPAFATGVLVCVEG